MVYSGKWHSLNLSNVAIHFPTHLVITILTLNIQIYGTVSTPTISIYAVTSSNVAIESTIRLSSSPIWFS